MRSFFCYNELMNVHDFASNLEKMTDPMAVGKVHYLQTKLKKLPICLQKKIVKSHTRGAGQMPLIVEPYCTFLFYKIPDPSKIQKFMPVGFHPATMKNPAPNLPTSSRP